LRRDKNGSALLVVAGGTVVTFWARLIHIQRTPPVPGTFDRKKDR
jgi:hypothetical protein